MEPKTIAVLIVIALIIVFVVWKKYRASKTGPASGGRGRGDFPPHERRK